MKVIADVSRIDILYDWSESNSLPVTKPTNPKNPNQPGYIYIYIHVLLSLWKLSMWTFSFVSRNIRSEKTKKKLQHLAIYFMRFTKRTIDPKLNSSFVFSWINFLCNVRNRSMAKHCCYKSQFLSFSLPPTRLVKPSHFASFSRVCRKYIYSTNRLYNPPNRWDLVYAL